MRRLCTSIALLGGLALLAGAAAAASPRGVSPARAQEDATATFQDATGEDADAPDITTITLSSDDAGLLTLQVTVPNRPTFTSDMELMVGFDTDDDPSTGPADICGSDYLLVVTPVAADDGATTASIGRWDGLRFANYKSYPSLFRYADGVATITVDRSALGGTGKFGFFVAVASNIDFANDDFDNLHEDDAPDAGTYSFDTGLQPLPPVVATKLLVRQAVLVPAKPKAGKQVIFGVAFVDDTGVVPSEGAVTCRASVGKQSLRASARQMVDGGAACAWPVPRGTKGKLLRGSLDVEAEGLELRKSFAVRIR
jgi:hypothetical protein